MKCIIQLAYNSVHFTAPEQYILEVRKKNVIKSPPLSGNSLLRRCTCVHFNYIFGLEYYSENFNT